MLLLVIAFKPTMVALKPKSVVTSMLPDFFEVSLLFYRFRSVISMDGAERLSRWPSLGLMLSQMVPDTPFTIQVGDNVSPLSWISSFV